MIFIGWKMACGKKKGKQNDNCHRDEIANINKCNQDWYQNTMYTLCIVKKNIQHA